MIPTDSAILPIVTLAQSAPAGAWAPIACAFVAGLVLWILGTKVLRAAFAVIGGAAGGFVGMVLLPLTGLPDVSLGAMTVGPQVIGMVVGGLIGLAVAAALFKFIITVGSGAVFAVAGVLAALIFLHFNAGAINTADPAPGAAEQIVQGADESGEAGGSVLDDLRERSDELRDAAADQVQGMIGDAAVDQADEAADSLLTDEQNEVFRDAAERSKAFLAEVGEVVTDEWDQRTARERVIILGSGTVGFVVGLLAGVVFTKRATAVITALLGSAVWIATGVALLRSTTGINPDTLSLAPTTWAVVWGGATVIGLVLQVGVLGRKHDNDDDDRDDDE